MRSTIYYFLLIVSTIYVIALHLEFNYTNLVVCRLQILVRASQAYLRYGTYIYPIQT